MDNEAIIEQVWKCLVVNMKTVGYSVSAIAVMLEMSEQEVEEILNNA